MSRLGSYWRHIEGVWVCARLDFSCRSVGAPRYLDAKLLAGLTSAVSLPPVLASLKIPRQLVLKKLVICFGKVCLDEGRWVLDL